MGHNILYTIGYEGKDLDDVVARMREFKIERVIDVRETPFSRKKGFSRPELRKRLEEECFGYVHIGKLGNPGHIRRTLNEDKDYQSFIQAFSAHLDKNQPAIEEAYAHAREATCCLLCYERLPSHCHRTLVAERIRERTGDNLEVVHI